MISGRDFHSPDSTVTSLLTTSGRLSSSCHPNPTASISYGDRPYESATAALEAYIADFDRSLDDPDTSTRQLTLLSTPVRSRNRVRNREVLQEQLTDGELDFLTLPWNSYHFSSERLAKDRLSLTTDEMLAIPCDGSLPVTRTSAFLCQSGTHSEGLTGDHTPLDGQYSWPSVRSDPRLASSTRAASVYHSTPIVPKSSVRPRARGSRASHRLEPSSSVPQHLPSQSTQTYLGTDTTDTAGHQPYPRWLTSQKSEMDFSGITSVPELNYPTWLREYDVSSRASPRDPSLQPQHKPHTLLTSPRLPSWLDQLDAPYVEQNQRKPGGGRNPDKERREADGGMADFPLRDVDAQYNTLRMQFAERLAQSVGEERSTDISNRFREEDMGCLILKAEKAMDSSSLGPREPLHTTGGSPTCTDDLLEAERSWDNPRVTFKSPVPVGEVEVLKDKQFQALGPCSPGSNSRKHPGPVEALKQMLFSLQAVEHEMGQCSPIDRAEPLQQDTAPQKDMVEFEDFYNCPGGQSLKRALHHLGRLKSLVEEPSHQNEELVQPKKD